MTELQIRTNIYTLGLFLLLATVSSYYFIYLPLIGATGVNTRNLVSTIFFLLYFFFILTIRITIDENGIKRTSILSILHITRVRYCNWIDLKITQGIGPFSTVILSSKITKYVVIQLGRPVFTNINPALNLILKYGSPYLSKEEIEMVKYHSTKHIWNFTWFSKY